MKHARDYFVLVILLNLILSLKAVSQENKQDKDKPNYILKTEFVTTPDGVKLATDVYFPVERKEKMLCLLGRTPYNKDHFKRDAEWFTNKGFVVVGQDCRGKFQSEGKWYPLRHDRSDGLATVRWIRQQPWSNGKIGGWGASYVGYTQWAISDALDVVTPHLTGADFYDLFYPGGLFSLNLAFRWGFHVDAQTDNPIPPEKMSASYRMLPLSVADDLTYADNQYINDWLSHPCFDEYWQSLSHRGIAACPVLSIGGWYDILLVAQLNDFEALNMKGHPDNRLVIGPWCHGSQAFPSDYGGREKVGDVGYFLKQFVIKHLTGRDVEVIKAPFKDKKYNLFIMERNEYYGSDEWPPKAVSSTNYYLGPGRCLGPKIPLWPGKAEYTYDPADPYPNLGGTFHMENVGPALQNPNLSRKDQVVFEGSVLRGPLTLLGPLSATLYVSTDVPCTDFIVCLQDVFPNGNIINIQEGGATVRFENAGVKKASVSVWATGYQLNPGHKLRAVITSSWFSRFNRNLNSGEPIFSAKTIKIAHQKIHFGPEHPSSITLPILNLED